MFVCVNDPECDVHLALITMLVSVFLVPYHLFHLQTLYCVELTDSRHIRRLLHGSEFVQIVMWT